MEIVLLIILIVLVVALFVISYMKKKKYNNELSQLRSELKVGDKVMTDTGVVGEVVDSYIEDEYKYFVLKSGKGSNVGYFTVHANAIYYVFGKEEKQTTQKVVVKPVDSKQEKSVDDNIVDVAESKEKEDNQNTKSAPEAKKESQEEKSSQKKSQTKKSNKK